MPIDLHKAVTSEGRYTSSAMVATSGRLLPPSNTVSRLPRMAPPEQKVPLSDVDDRVCTGPKLSKSENLTYYV